MISQEAPYQVTEGHRMKHTPAGSPSMSIAEVARARGVGVPTVRRWIATGRLPAYRVGPRLIRVDPADVARLDRPIPTAADLDAHIQRRQRSSLGRPA